MSSGTRANRKAVRKYPATDRDAGRGRENKTEYLYEYGILGNITKIAEDGKTYGRVIIMIMTGNSVLCAK